MNPLKRRAQDCELLPLRTAKVPRMAKQRPNGDVCSPSETHGTLSRWVASTINLMRNPAVLFESNYPTPSPSPPRHASPASTQTPSRSPPSSSTSPDTHVLTPRNSQSLTSLAPPPSQTSTSSPPRRPIPSRSSMSKATTSPPSTSNLSAQIRPPPRHSSSTRVNQVLDESLIKQKAEEFFMNGPERQYRNKKHIFHKTHKEKVRTDRKRDHEDMQKDLFTLKRASGYSSNYETFKSWLDYRARLEMLEKGQILSPSSSLTDLRSSRSTFSPGRRHSDPVDTVFLQRALAKARQTMNEPKPPKPLTPNYQKLLDARSAKDAEIAGRLKKKLPSSLPPHDEAQVDSFLRTPGFTAKYAREQVTNADIIRLRPAQWLNDEIINFYGALILGRSDGCKENTAVNGKGAGNKPLNCHYFSSFFWPKLKGDGYEKARLGKWTKKFDIFEKDVVLLPVNHNNAHWTSAAINFRRKRIESYDSMNMYHKTVFKHLRGYLDAESRAKRKKPFDFTGWVDYVGDDTPQQENGYDCGVFTCCFLEALSRGVESFPFAQENMPYLRRRMIWEIGNTRLRENYS